jgi:hypothetical protein
MILHVETEDPIPSGSKGKLVSQLMDGRNTDTCVRFWYFMYSNQDRNLGSLNVYLYDVSSNRSTLFWSLQYSQGRMWKEARFSYAIDQSHQIIFEGVKGAGWGDIALDDITLIQSSVCDLTPSQANPNQITTSKTTTTTSTSTSTKIITTTRWQPQSPYDCSFETDFCEWENDTTADFTWKRNKGPVIANSGNKSSFC